MGLDLLNEVGLGLSANQLIYYLATLDEKDRRNAGDAIINGELRVVVYIHLSYIDLAVIFFRKFFDHGSDGATRSTPFSPKIYNCELVGGDHLVLEISICEF